jgi:hypothetical protein
MEIGTNMRRTLAVLAILATAFIFEGCGSKGEDYDPNKIAVKQPGGGPPPMNTPMGSNQDKAKTSR